LALLATPAASATLEVVVTNVRNDRGHVRVAACTSDTFLQENCRYNAKVKSAQGEVLVVMTLPPGTWALQAYQDEDDSGKINRNFLGIPTEGIGFSNDAPIRFGPPTFRAAAIQVGPDGGRVRLKLRYF